MHIYMDAQSLLGLRTGVFRYTSNLIRQLAGDPQLRLHALVNRLFRSTVGVPPRLVPAGVGLLNSRYPYHLIRRWLPPNIGYRVPLDLMANPKADLFHGPNFTYMPLQKGRTVITIHDLAFLKYPETTSPEIYKHHSRWVPYCAKTCDHIIAVSEHTKRDIVELLNIRPEKITVTHLAASNRFRVLPPEAVAPIVRKYGLPAKYILFVGTLEPRKNLTGLLSSYQIMLKNSDTPCKLVIAGAPGWRFDPIYHKVKELRLESYVHFTGYVEDEDLPAIYNGASLFVMPSIYEGFGIPIVEAMRCGVPVVGSGVSSIPEVVGEYGVLVSPHRHEEWAAQMHALTANPAVRARYAELSLIRGGQFRWSEVARRTLDVYNRVLDGGS